MQDVISVRLHEIVLIIYMICLGCYFYDFIQKNSKVRKFGYYTLGIVWIFQTIFLCIYIDVSYTHLDVYKRQHF